MPVIVHAGYRCERHNAEVGGLPRSEHTRGLAADIHLPGLSLQRMYELALEVPQFAQGGIGVYDGGFLHVDVRDHRARWARVSGRYVGVEQLVRDLATEATGVSPVVSGEDARLSTEFRELTGGDYTG